MKNFCKGFTIIELLVTMSVIAIVSGIALLNFHTGNENLALQRAANKVAQDIRRAADLSIQAEQDTYCGGTLSGYGLYADMVTTDSYIMYANCNGVAKEGYDSSSDVIVETIVLDDSVVIKDISTPTNALGVSFFPPDPRAALCKNDSCPGESSASITLALKGDPSKTKVVQINKGGFPDVN